MATSKTASMPSRSTLPSRKGGAGALLRPLLALLVLLIVAGASVAITWYLTTRNIQQNAAPVQIGVGQGGAVNGTPGAPGAPGAPAPTTFVAAPTTPAVVPAPIFIPLEAFTVTLQSPETERILHVGLTLRVGDDQTRQRIEKYMPEVRSRILMVLSAQSPQAVQTAQGKNDLAAAIAQAVNRPFSPLPDGQYVTDVLFTAFVVQ
ncbi:flagellar basal body protein FliL [Bordetella genomosp. 1]|uniref:Flagellar protein FliL n=1 Tax=Bordetella genomosp. 1 TaxID=1395607 RepID=A0A261SCL6_9BORD|nr:flagellar basal body-associated protein FliL [Bordetella genomosp. 1]MDQ8035683.1 flagellar basal body-associated protein FliL [Bordetella sp.]OZI35139.1 flagellar basal body protein FliL [Bordetella genomosp. 1]OZI63678.1 flagellar basal body protein FliL [Bordetella genomosp. 1]